MEEDVSGAGGGTGDATAKLLTCGGTVMRASTSRSAHRSSSNNGSIMSPTFLLDFPNMYSPTLELADRRRVVGEQPFHGLLYSKRRNICHCLEQHHTANLIFARLRRHNKIKMLGNGQRWTRQRGDRMNRRISAIGPKQTCELLQQSLVSEIKNLLL